MKIRVGLVGLGKAWQSRYRPALRTLGDRLEVRAVCEPVAHRAALAATEFGAAPVDGFRALAGRDDIDAVLLLSTQWYGALPILAACDAGKAIYCASGLELDPEGARQIKERVEKAGIAFVAELPCRQSPATLRLKELIATRLGQPRLLFCHRRRQVCDSTNGEAEAEATQELVEAVDWCRYLVDREPTSAIGVVHREHPDAPDSDYEMMTLDFSPPGQPGTGTIAQISSGRYVATTWPEAVSFRPPAELQMVCERGVAFVDLPASIIWFDDAGRHMESLDSERPVGEQLLLHFYRSVTSLVRDRSNLEDAHQAIRIVAQARRSQQQGRRIDIAEAVDDSGR